MAKRKRTMRWNQSRQLKCIISLLLISLMAFGCSDGGDSSSSAKKGQFLDSAVEGITYESGDRSGTTDEDGTFEYDEGEAVTFSVGDILLGEADGEAIVTPVDLVDNATDETNPVVTNITRFLLTLDSDEDPSNGISVPDTVRNAAVGISINFKVSISAFENDPSVQGFLANVGITILVSVEFAQNHLGSTLDDIDNDGDTFTENAGDCDDANPDVYPGAEDICGDGIDQDCDGADLICPEDLDADDDGDSFSENAGDCDDTDPAIYPGADEICGDSIDQDCNGSDLDCTDPLDVDDDGDTFSENAGDCDDTDPAIYPGATEICGDTIDQDCNGSDLDCTDPLAVDDDGDTFSENAGDCDDTNAAVYPGATEICGDTIDQDCNGSDLDCTDPLAVDDDGDTFSENAGDCDDTNPAVYPEADEICGDGIDQDCDGSDEACPPDPLDVDDDGDTFSENQNDCNDADASVYPGADEICGDGIDQDCDGTDLICLEDVDNDADGFTENQGDCDDSNPAAYPGAAEICGDGVDQDCDNADLICVEDVDDDADGFTENQGDCNDSDALINPAATDICGDGIDQDCSGTDLECPPEDVDDDGDGVSENQGDCDDTDAAVNPDATEVCGNGKDDDCADGDLSCDDADIDEDGYSITQGDCDDTNANINPGSFEICGDEIDQDCDGNDVLCPEDVDDDEDGFTENQGDCDDTNSGIRPGVRDVCGDDIDQDCDGSDLSCDDADNDGDTFSENQGDCNDADDTIYPGAEEICGDGIDQDCDESDMICLEDVDNDGDGFTENQGDCNDEDPAAFPGADEICGDGIDQDCDESDLICPEDMDDDGDGFTENQNDCNDADASVYPGAEEVCGDGIDQDCDGSDVICVGDSGEVQTGVFLFNLVVGVEYRTSTLYGVTNSQGEFKYAKGENVTFSVGSIVLGMALGQNVITPVDLVEGASDESDPAVTNICRLLMTLDDDGNPDNGISITDAVINATAGMSVDFNVSFEDFELNTQDMVFRLTAFTSASVRPLVSAEAAQTLLIAAIASIEVTVSNIVTVVGETQTSISWDPVATADAYVVHAGYAPGVYELSYEVSVPSVDIPINSGEIIYFAIAVIQGGIEISVSVETPTFIRQGSVSGQVLASKDGTPIPNATVHLDIPGSSIDVLTDVEGSYAIEVPSLGDYCLISAGKEGYVPATANISKELLAGVDTLVMNFELDEAEVVDGSVIILEILPEVHHLGDDEYTGAVNSQFQKLSEGITFTRTFSLSADQLPQNCGVSSADDSEADDSASDTNRKRSDSEDNLAELRLVVKGAQERNTVHINGNLLSVSITDSPEDGSFGEVILPIDASYLKEGENTLTITSIDGGRTFDDFEFANVLIYLYCQEIIIGDDGDGDGYTLEDGDCDDTDPDAYPGAAEICGDGIDQDCDGTDAVCTTGTWTDMSLGGTQKFRSVWGSAADDVFVVGEKGTILHYDGTAWTTAYTGTTHEHFYDVWGCSGDSVYVVGEKGTVLHYNGTDWTNMSLGKSVKLYGVWGSGCDNVFVAGEKGVIYHYDGTEWTTAYTGTTREHFYDIWGCSGDDVYVAGEKGTILHYDGTEWASMSLEKSAQLYGIWGSDCDNLFAVGDKSTVLHYNGVEWTSFAISGTGTKGYFYGVWGSAGNDVFVMGEKGSILRYNGIEWKTLSVGKSKQFYGVWGIADTVFVVGEKGAIFYYGGTGSGS